MLRQIVTHQFGTHAATAADLNNLKAQRPAAAARKCLSHIW